MTARELRLALAKLPVDTEIQLSSRGDSASSLIFLRYRPQENALYLADKREDEAVESALYLPTSGRRQVPKLDKWTLTRIRDYAQKGREIAKNKRDGATHTVMVYASVWDEYMFGGLIHHHEWLSLIVDDFREDGGKMGVGTQYLLCKFEQQALPPDLTKTTLS